MLSVTHLLLRSLPRTHHHARRTSPFGPGGARTVLLRSIGGDIGDPVPVAVRMRNEVGVGRAPDLGRRMGTRTRTAGRRSRTRPGDGVPHRGEIDRKDLGLVVPTRTPTAVLSIACARSLFRLGRCWGG